MNRIEFYASGRDSPVNLKLKNMRFSFEARVPDESEHMELADQYACPAPEDPLSLYDVVVRQDVSGWSVSSASLQDSGSSSFMDAIDIATGLLNSSRDYQQRILVVGSATLTMNDASDAGPCMIRVPSF